MSDIKTTPGPWGILDMGGDLCIVSAPDLLVTALSSRADLDQRMADARLIAVAPDLLKALEAVLGMGDGVDCRIGDRSGDIIDAAHDAIAKARGGK